MTRILALMALAPALLAAAPASAQVQNCGGAITIERVDYGTQRVTRDPRNPASSNLVTLSVTVRNLSPAQQRFTASYNSRAVQQDFLAGQSWTLDTGGRTDIIVANVLRPGEPETTVRQMLQFTCR
jgi:hypothetical protein